MYLSYYFTKLIQNVNTNFFLISIFLQCFQSASGNQSMEFRKSMVRLISSVAGCWMLTELCCYLGFFAHIFHHDNNIAIGVVAPSVLKNRNRTNAITMAGQAASWIMEIWYLVIVGILSTIIQVDILREISVVLKALEFCLIPFVQIYTSAPIKKYLEANNKFVVLIFRLQK